jgi:hypothetical protein
MNHYESIQPSFTHDFCGAWCSHANQGCSRTSSAQRWGWKAFRDTSQLLRARQLMSWTSKYIYIYVYHISYIIIYIYIIMYIFIIYYIYISYNISIWYTINIYIWYNIYMIIYVYIYNLIYIGKTLYCSYLGLLLDLWWTSTATKNPFESKEWKMGLQIQKRNTVQMH